MARCVEGDLARVEHVFAVVKRPWGFGKLRCPGLARNATRSLVATSLANVYFARGVLDAGVRP
jgi:IS5 family transposase